VIYTVPPESSTKIKTGCHLMIYVYSKEVAAMNKRIINSDNLAFILSSSRCEANKSQKYMAQSLGRSVGTIQNWEAGIGAPNLLDTLEWFDVLGLNPLRYMLNFVYPDTYMDLSAASSDEDIRAALLHYINDVASASEIRKLSYSIFGNTGSSWLAQLDMLTAHNHTSMRSRVNAAQTILDSYEMETARGELVGSQNILPDKENLRTAINDGKNAVLNGQTGYTHISSNEIK
jgi:hypothetical protein